MLKIVSIYLLQHFFQQQEKKYDYFAAVCNEKNSPVKLPDWLTCKANQFLTNYHN